MMVMLLNTGKNGNLETTLPLRRFPENIMRVLGYTKGGAPRLEPGPRNAREQKHKKADNDGDDTTGGRASKTSPAISCTHSFDFS